MTIAYIMRYWPVCGGVETVTATLANELVKHGYNVHIIYAYRKDINPMPYLLDDRIKEVRLCTIEKTKANVASIVEYLKEHHISIVINQWGSDDLCSEVKKVSGIKLVNCWHMCLISAQVRNQKPYTFKQKLYHRVMGEHCYRKWWIRIHMRPHLMRERMCDRYILLSDAYKCEYMNWCGQNSTDAIKLDSIPNPLTYNFNYDIGQYDNKKKEVLFVGRIVEGHKRLSHILRIWKLIEVDSVLKEWNLRIVGDGEDMEATQELSKQLGLERVVFEGFKDPRPYYEQASIIMMTSTFEGFPMVLVEAQQYAVVPVVMDSFSALHDIIVNQENGIIVGDNDIHGFAAGMKELMLNYDYRKQLAQNGLDSCKRYEVGKIADRWEALFNELKC